MRRLLLVSIFMSLATAPMVADKPPGCQAFFGPFSSVVVAQPACKSPVGLCTHGILTDEFPATYDFAALTQKADPSDTTTIILTGTSVVTAADGLLFTNDTSVLHLTTGAFVTKALVREGTKQFEDTSGGFIATGVLNLQTGQAHGTYSAILCLPEKD